MRQALTASPTAVTGLTTGVDYTMYNRSPRTIYFEAASAAPSDPENAFPLRPEQTATIKKNAGQEVYIWSPDPHAGHVGFGSVVVDEAA